MCSLLFNIAAFEISLEFSEIITCNQATICEDGTITLSCRHSATQADPTWLTDRLPGTILNTLDSVHYKQVHFSRNEHTLQLYQVPLSWNASSYTCNYGVHLISNPVVLYVSGIDTVCVCGSCIRITNYQFTIIVEASWCFNMYQKYI